MPERTIRAVDELLASARDVALMDSCGVSGASLYRLRIHDDPYVLKFLDWDADWTLRASGVREGAVAVLWQRGLLDRLPDCFRQPIVMVFPGSPTAVLMRDVSAWLLPADGSVIGLDQHLRFLDHLAALHAAFWEAGPEIDVVDAATRFRELGPLTAVREAGSGAVVPELIGKGWPRLAEVAPRAAALATPLATDPSRLTNALAETPQTFVHGNLKLDNLGTDDRGRTVLLDWELPGRGAPLGDLVWYLAINCRRLPQSKEDAIAAYRAALERRGVDTAPWWDRQLGLSLLGGLVWFGWEKALGGYDDELAWWERAALDGAAYLP